MSHHVIMILALLHPLYYIEDHIAYHLISPKLIVLAVAYTGRGMQGWVYLMPAIGKVYIEWYCSCCVNIKPYLSSFVALS